MSAGKIYVQCNPLLDISAHVDKEFLAKYKLEPVGMATPDQMGIYKELSDRADVKLIPGGAGLNTARVAQWMLQAPKGSVVSYVGAIGTDERGAILKKSAEDEGVKMAVQVVGEEPTGTCAVCIVGKERSLLANIGASAKLEVAHLEGSEVSTIVNEAKFFYFTGFTLTLSAEHVLTVAKRAAKSGALFTLNLSAPFLMQVPPFAAAMREVLPFVDVIFSNDDEALEFAKFNSWETTDIKEIAKKAVALPKANDRPRTVIFTQGSKPTVMATQEGVVEVEVPAIAADKIVDTNAAGDSFVGGFLAAVSAGKSFVEGIKAGNYAAGVVIQHDGCTFPAKPDYAL